MEEFRIPQEQVPVEVLLQDGTRSTGQAFVPVVGPDSHPEPLVDRLNGDERFLPFLGDDGFEMLHKHSIRWIRLAGPQASAVGDEPSEQRAVTLELADGETLEGEVHYVLPHERSRLIDYLNVAPLFIDVMCEDGRTLVNVDHVTRIRSLTPEPA